MSANYFDRLEAELRGAVPRASARHARPWWRPLRQRPLLGPLGVAFGIAVTLVVVLLAVTLGAHRHAATHPPTSVHRSVGPSGQPGYPLGAVPTLHQLLENFAVLRRPQTPQDRSGPNLGGTPGSQVNRLTRLARTLPGGYRVYLQVERPLFLAAPRHLKPAGSYVLGITILGRSGYGTGDSFSPSTQYDVYPVSTTGNDAVWASIIPDGVATVRWTFRCLAPRAHTRPCGIRPRTYTLPVINNVAASSIPGPGRAGVAPTQGCARCAMQVPSQVAWLASDGTVVASFNLAYNLSAPPFVEGGLGPRTLPVLGPNTLGSARLQQPWQSANRAIDMLLGPPADANVVDRGCGIDHETVWTSPEAANPLTVFERHGQFVGYQYGAPVNEIGLQKGPGAVLATARGLTLADTIGVARRLYGSHLMTSAASGGTWRATADGGTLRGAVLPITYPLRTVTAKNPVATIQAGMTGCAVKGSG